MLSLTQSPSADSSSGGRRMSSDAPQQELGVVHMHMHRCHGDVYLHNLKRENMHREIHRDVGERLSFTFAKTAWP